MPALGSPILIDGAHGEGGGGLIRAALVMSALTQQPLRLENIRGGTNHPGLDFEDIALVRALATCTSAEIVGADIGSSSLSYLPTQRPKGLKQALDLPGEHTRRNPNALVVLNALLPVMARSGMYSIVSLKGETYGHHALTYDYFANVTLPTLARLGIGATADLERAGFGREAAGEVTMEVEPSSIVGFQWPDRGKLLACRATLVTSDMPALIGQRGISHLEKMAQHAKVSIDAETFPVEAANRGVFVTVWCQYERGMAGATAMGSRGVRVETLVQAAFEEVLNWMATDATVDPFLADQILIPAALAEEGSTFKVNELTKRFLTTVWVVKQFLPIHITVRGVEGEPGVVTVRR